MCVKNCGASTHARTDQNGNFCATSYVAMLASKKYFVVGDVSEMVKDATGNKKDEQTS